ncbi:MAG: carbamoyl-phosphate synthase small subunit [Nitrospiraceae bacterium]|nr:carbamoyl-phosphate synthase small subunit [Nitrospiraceae bacterium]MSR24922.1 carbamoyl-phosphate synthase small subunit [Nitrospiraceae bacterium]
MGKAVLALADGTVFDGQALGHEGETMGEVVFNTAMTGYQEILTDPSYKGQIVTMTCPHIGNYGVTQQDTESRRIWAEGFIVKESGRRPSNWRAEQSLDEYLKESRVVGIQGIDTRELTRHLRETGSQQGIISHVDLDHRRATEKARTAPSIVGRDLAAEVTCGKSYEWTEGSGSWTPVTNGQQPNKPVRRFNIVVYDFGVKRNILRRLVDVGCAVTVVPASTPAKAVEALMPDGVVLSNGPGDPEGVPYAVEAAKALIGTRPILGICLGHQILGLAFGLKTYKLKFGHHAANHPVMDLRTRKVEITSQNHNFAVRPPEGATVAAAKPPVLTTPFGRVAVSHLSLNDDSVEGMVCLDQPVLSVQYHPEASPGPHDSAYLFEQFIGMMEKSHA